MVLPNFICVGAEKGGTTPLFRILVQHRDIFMPRNKETHYFTQLWNWKPLAFYEAHFFKGCAGERAVGEATPEYMRFPEVPARLSEALGRDLKLIFCLRDPVKRAFSQYHLRCRLMEETESFEVAVALEAKRTAANPYLGRRQAYLGGSRYLEQIERFLPHFPRENMFFMILEEDLKENRAATVSRLLDFLDVGPDPKIRLDVIDSSNAAPRVRFSSEARPIHSRTKTGRHRLPPGTIAFETGNNWADSIVERPSSYALDHFRRLARNLTVELDEELARQLYRNEFKNEVDGLETFLGRDLSCWRRD
ncbi:MAG: sulfotransferase domain-containing protein [Pseudomonadota bacterium]